MIGYCRLKIDDWGAKFRTQERRGSYPELAKYKENWSCSVRDVAPIK